MKIGFIGAGNMASAILRGAVASGNFAPEALGAFDLDGAKTEGLRAELGVHAYDSAEALIADCEAVVLAVKPNVFASLLPKLNAALTAKKPLLLSIAAGKTIAFIESLLETNLPVIRIMPNINAAVGASMSAYCCNEQVDEEQKQFAHTLCSSFGGVIALPEAQFPIFGVIAGCAPAYAFMFIDALARAGVKNGLPKADALEIAAQTVLGSARHILESDKHPYALVDSVCSPGGTTIEGVVSLQNDGLDAAVIHAVDAALFKDSKI